MRSKIFILNFCLLLSSLFYSNLFGQRIGVIEKNNFSSLFVDGKNNPQHYKIFIRELFEKKNNIWTHIYNSPDIHPNQPVKIRTHYLLEEPNKKIIVQGIKNKRDIKSWLASELFRVEKPRGIQLHQLPKSILRGFEYNDILAYRIVTGKSVRRKNISLFRTEYLSDTLKNRLYEVLVAKFESCYLKNDTTNFMAIRKNHIHNQVRIISDSIKLGQVDIVSGNNCFAEEGRSYGGGILHYIIYPNQEIKLLVTNTELVDVADYDNDGKFEYVFFKSWFNNYGYLLYYNNFQSYVVNEWSYH